MNDAADRLGGVFVSAGVETDREYTLLSYEVNTAWKNDSEQHAFAAPPGATDDFRYGMALNPHMRAFITHAWETSRHAFTAAIAAFVADAV